MRGLKILTVVMAVLIVVGVVTLGVVMTRRLGGLVAGAADTRLGEPDGTEIAGIAATADRVALQLRGGGPDRVVLVDAKTGKPVGRIIVGK